MIKAYRLSSSRYAPNSGRGAAFYGGRWNPPGVEAVYAAASPALAALEVLVHFSVLPRDFVLTEIVIPDSVSVETVAEADLPAGWNDLFSGKATQAFGRKWFKQARSVLLIVPSSIVPVDQNFVLNPRHPDFKHIQFRPPVPFRFDPRLK